MTATAPRPAAKKRLSRLPGATLCMALGPLLAVQLGLLWLLQDDAGVTLPDFADARAKAALAKAGISGDWSKARVDLSGRIELTDAKLGTAAGEPVLEARRLVAVLDPYDLLFSGKATPLRLWLDDGRLLCPAYGSPSGKTETALDHVRIAARREGDRLIVSTLQAKCADIPIVAHGRLLPSIAAAGGGASSKKTGTDPLRAVVQASSRIVALQPALKQLRGASLELAGEDVAGGVRLSLDGMVGAADYEGVAVRDIRLHIGAVWDAAGPRPDGRATFVIGSASIDRKASGSTPALRATTGRVSLRTNFGPDWSLPKEANLTAHHLVASDAPVDRLDVFCDWSAYPSLRLRADALWREEHVSVSGVADVDARSAALDFKAGLIYPELRAHPAFPAKLPQELRDLRVTGLAEASGRVEFAPGGAFTRALVALRTGDTRLGALELGSLAARAEITPDSVAVTGIEGVAEGQRITGAFRTGFKDDSPYRVLLRGDIYPGQVEPFVGKWWHRIWKDLAVAPGHPAYGDVDVEGRWEGLPYESIFISASARKLSYHGRVFDRASVRVIEVPDRIWVGDLVARNADGTNASGTLEWVYPLPEHKLDSVRFLFKGDLPLDVAAGLGGPDVVAAVSDITLEKPASAEVIGRYHGPASPTPDREALEVRVASKGPFTAWKIPGEDFSGTVLIDGARIRVKDATFRYAGGAAKADVWVHRLPEGYRATFDTAFDKADRAAFFSGLANLGDKPPAPPAPAKPEAGSAEERAPEKTGLSIGIPGLVSIDTNIGADEDKAASKAPAKPVISGRLFARIKLPDIATLDGEGRFETLDRDLFRVPLFGAVTRGLEKMGVSAGNYRFDSASGDFTIRQGAVWFPLLVVRGRDASVEATGRYHIVDEGLHFRAILNPKSPDKIPLLGWVRKTVNKTTRLFPVDIRGTLEKPDWSLDPSPGALFSSQLDKSQGTPPPPPENDGRW